MAPRSIKEEYLLTGPLEKTNEPYAITKIARIKFCETCRYQYGANYNEKIIINIGSGTDVSIKALALLVKEITGFTGQLFFDTTKPDGMPPKLLDSTKINKPGWHYKTGL